MTASDDEAELACLRISLRICRCSLLLCNVENAENKTQIPVALFAQDGCPWVA